MHATIRCYLLNPAFLLKVIWYLTLRLLRVRLQCAHLKINLYDYKMNVGDIIHVNNKYYKITEIHATTAICQSQDDQASYVLPLKSLKFAFHGTLSDRLAKTYEQPAINVDCITDVLVTADIGSYKEYPEYPEGTYNIVHPYLRQRGSTKGHDIFYREYRGNQHVYVPHDVRKDTLVQDIPKLPKIQHPNLYDALEIICSHARDSFNKICRDVLKMNLPETYQVYIKFTSQRKFKQDEWHHDGLPEENIIATAIYCLSRSNSLRGGRILFRTETEKKETEALGHRDLLPGTLIVFPNSLSYRQDPFVGDGSIELITLYLANPQAKILSWQHPQGVISTMERGHISKHIH